MIDYDWCCLGDAPVKASEDIWHAVAPYSPTTVCGLAVANPDEEWRWTGSLGRLRPCDNCDKIIALKADTQAAAPQGEPSMSLAIAWIYNTWAKVPAAVRAGLSLFVMALVTAGMAFGWHFPTDWVDAKQEIALFWVFIVPVAYGLFQKWIWPPLFAWLLTLLHLGYTAQVGKSKPLLLIKI